MEFNGGGRPNPAAPPVQGPGVDARPLPAWGVFARNVRRLTLENVRLATATNDLRPAVIASGVDHLRLDSFRFPPAPLPAAALAGSSVRHLDWPDAGALTNQIRLEP